MTDKWHGGKGDRPRKDRKDELYQQGWDRIFGRKDSQSQTDSHKGESDSDTERGYRVGDFHKAKR